MKKREIKDLVESLDTYEISNDKVMDKFNQKGGVKPLKKRGIAKKRAYARRLKRVKWLLSIRAIKKELKAIENKE